MMSFLSWLIFFCVCGYFYSHSKRKKKGLETQGQQAKHKPVSRRPITSEQRVTNQKYLETQRQLVNDQPVSRQQIMLEQQVTDQKYLETQRQLVNYQPVSRRPIISEQRVIEPQEVVEDHVQAPHSVSSDDGLETFTLKTTDHLWSNGLVSQAVYLEPDGEEDDENNLHSIRLVYGAAAEVKSKNNSRGVFKHPGEVVSVGGYTLTGGLFYFGGWVPTVKSQYDYFSVQTESALIDDSLPTASANFTYEDETLSYWPKYSSISALCRGAYLCWLAGARDQPETPLGYVFIYFYGLERRVLVDQANGEVSHEQLRMIYDELWRLRRIYGESRSFYGYATRLIEYIAIIAPQVAIIEEAEIDPDLRSLLFRYHLAQTVDAGQPISATLAFLWLRAWPEYRLRTPARRCFALFEQLFKWRYREKFGEGLVVKPNKTRLNLTYLAASSSLRGLESFKVDYPDPSVLSAPLKKWVAIADLCTDELEPYSRYLGREGHNKEDLAGILLLPPSLANAANAPVLAAFKNWADEQINNQQGLATTQELWRTIDLPIPTSITKKHIDLMTTLCDRMGLAFAPDPRFHHAKPTIDGNMVLFNSSSLDHFKPSANFNGLALVLQLGAMMASADGQIDDSEVTVLQSLIDHDSRLSGSEKISLHAYLLWRMHTPVNMAGLKARLDVVGNQEKEALSHILVGIALADGRVDLAEVKQLEKFYTTLGLDKTMVSGDIHRLSTTAVVNPKVSPAVNQAQGITPGFYLDEALLAMHESDTIAVQTMLGAIFMDETLQQQTIEPTDDEPVAVAQYPGLPSGHQILFDTLLDQERWTRDEVEQMCHRAGLMVDGAIELINDWAYEQVDAPVLEDAGDILIDREIADQITQIVTGAI